MLPENSARRIHLALCVKLTRRGLWIKSESDSMNLIEIPDPAIRHALLDEAVGPLRHVSSQSRTVAGLYMV